MSRARIAGALGAAVLSVAGGARAQGGAAASGPTVQYTTRAGDTCTSIAERVYGSATRIDVIHTYNSLGPMPHTFPAGRTLTLPRNPPPPRPSADAEVSAVRNDVHAYTPGDHRARSQEPLSRGHRVGTNGDSNADVTMANERGVHLEENTLVVVLGRYSFQTQRRETAQDTQLERGTLRTQLAALMGGPPPQPIAVSTPAAQVTASAGETEVTVDPNRSTRVAVLSGQAEVRAGGRTVVVPEGQGTTAERGRPPAPPHPLPPRPEWDQSPPRLTFLTGQTLAALGSYRVRANANVVTRWRVQLARDERFRDILVDRRVEPTVTRFEARDLPAGRYFLRVRSVDAQRFESQPSAVQRFAVVAPEVIPSIPGRRAAVRLLDGLYCGLDGAALATVSGPVELSPGRAHTVRCADNAEGAASAEHAIAAADSGLILARGRVGDAGWSRAGGTRRVALRVMDAAGAPLPGFEVSATTEHGELGPLAPSTEPGTYITTLRWQGPAPATRIHVRVQGADAGDVAVPAAQPPAGFVFDSDAPVARAPTGPDPDAEDARRIRPFSAGVGAGALLSFGSLGTGFTAALSGRYRIHTEAVDFLIGIQLGYQRFECGGGTAAAGSYCTRAAVAPQDPSVSVDGFSAGIPLGVARRIADIFVPYVTITPEVALARARIAPLVPADGPLRAGFGLLGVFGLQLDLRAHAPFIEVGYRYAELSDTRFGTLAAGGLSLTAGYRVQW